MTDSPSPRLYLTTPPVFDPEALARELAGILEAVGIACVRLALDATADEDAWTRAVNHLMPVCHAADVPLMVSDHFRLVGPLGLDGVHLASSRTPLREVRKALGPDRIVGAFAGTSRHQGMVLAEAGADYVAFGPVGAAGGLGDDVCADDELFAWWAEMIEVPSVAEGRVTIEDAARLAATADFVVPERSVWADPARTIERLRAYAAVLPEPDTAP